MGPLEILLIVVGISILVIVHETGHYLAARAFGMRVVKYSIGLGPTLFKYKPKGSPTTFQVAAIPFLAYVQIAGMNPHDPEDDPDDPGVFSNQSLLARTVTIAAGPFANYLAAGVIAFFIGLGGWPAWVETLLAEPARVGEVTASSPAAAAGLEAGDVFLTVDGEEALTFAAIQRATASRPGEEIQYRVRRGNETLTVPISPAAVVVRTNETPLAEAGLESGDVLLSVEGREGAVLTALRAAIENNEAVTVHIRRDDEEKTVTFNAEAVAALEGRTLGQIGVRSPESRPYDVGEAAWTALVYPWRLTRLQLEGIGRMFRDADTSELGGPVAMGQMIGTAAKRGASHYFAMIVILSVALGLFNLLPFPALDGGRLVFLGYEVVTRRKPNERLEAWVHTVGIIFLLGVLVLVTFRDIGNLFN
ncbi:MAG: RIP metalloprotease RseP [Myxococcota bacterium]